ncbi:hypothetical protein GPN2_12093 [Streptomyces murinus]
MGPHGLPNPFHWLTRTAFPGAWGRGGPGAGETRQTVAVRKGRGQRPRRQQRVTPRR